MVFFFVLYLFVVFFFFYVLKKNPVLLNVVSVLFFQPIQVWLGTYHLTNLLMNLD